MTTTTQARSGFDPRPVVLEGPGGPVILGGRCKSCHHPTATGAPRCPRCAGELSAAEFGPLGTVWSSTTIHVASRDRAAPYTLAYVDLDAGPRILAHVEEGPTVAVRVAERTRLVGVTEHGDPRVAVIR